MSKTAIEKTKPQLPAMAHTPSLDLGSDDIQTPRLYIGSGMSAAVAEGLVVTGDLYSATSKEDPAPEVLFSPKEAGEGVLIHVLGMTKSLSKSEGGEFERWALGDPDAPSDADLNYNYTLCLPEVDAVMPYRMSFKRTAMAAARLMNTALLRQEGILPAYALAFRLTTKQRKTDKFTWYIPVIKAVEADSAHVDAAGKLASLIAGSQAQQAQTELSAASKPAI